jgi:hypothetical protein
MSLKEQLSKHDAINKYRVYSTADLVRLELGIKGFKEVESIFSEIKGMIDEVIAIAEVSNVISWDLFSQFNRYIGEYNNLAGAVMQYNLDNDNNFSQRNNIIKSVREWRTALFNGFDVNKNSNNFLLLYNTIKMYGLQSLQNDKTEIDRLKKTAEQLNYEAVEILNSIKNTASRETVENYAIIFQNQASNHSQLEISLKPFKFRLGNAQIWLMLAFVLIFGFIRFIFKIQDILPIDFTSDNSKIILELITRLVVVSFCIYLITFSLKQYNVQKHLYTLNKHRQNTLDSYKLFIDSLDQNDGTVRNALMMEVAKAIYEAGQTGYISQKDGADGSSSIIEMTRLVNQGKGI